MQSLLKLVNKPRVDDWSPLAKFYYADEALNALTCELDSFDSRRDPERCNHLVAKLRQAQDRLLHIISEMLVIVFPRESDRVSRDYRIKFPDEIIHDNLPGQLLFGAECLTAGSNIMEHEAESEAIRPLAQALTKHLEQLRELLKDQSLRDPTQYSERIKLSLKTFDHLFAEFELNYVSAMVPVKSVKEHDCQLDIAVLFADTLERALKLGYITQENIDYCDPNVMITLPRLAIVSGLLDFPEGALNVDGAPENLSDMFRPFYSLLKKIRDLLRLLNEVELNSLELALCSGEHSQKDESPQNSFTMSKYCDNIAKYQTTSNSFRNQASGSEDSDDSVSLNNSKMILMNEKNLSFTEQILKDEIVVDEKGNNVDFVSSRARFRSSADLVHRLFVCIAGVADQLQTNYPSDIRRVLKMVLQPNEIVPVFEIAGQTASVPENEEETGVEMRESLPLPAFIGVRWVPDSDCEQCTACGAPFTLVRRRHHCRNCGRIFCSKCSANSLPIPELGYDRKVRVCNLCYLYRINPFSTNDRQTSNIHSQNNAATNSSSAMTLVTN